MVENKGSWDPKMPVLLFVLAILTTGTIVAKDVRFVRKPNQIDVLVGDELFTGYMYGPDLMKPILYPIRTPGKVTVNRNYPLGEVDGESQDHPHHVGLFFTYEINQYDNFWGKTAPPPQIRHVEILDIDDETGLLSTRLHWIGVSGKVILEEKRIMRFHGDSKKNIVDLSITLTAKDTTVVFQATKEGMFALRVADWLREKGGSGRYLAGGGSDSADAIWGTRQKWVRLQGGWDNKEAGVAILNHPESLNYPTFWHVRNYGLFSANPLGQSAFEKAKGVIDVEAFQLTLKPDQSALFKFRVIVYDGTLSKSALDRHHEEYSKVPQD